MSSTGCKWSSLKAPNIKHSFFWHKSRLFWEKFETYDWVDWVATQEIWVVSQVSRLKSTDWVAIDKPIHGGEGKGIRGGNLLSLCPSTKSGGHLLPPPPKFKEEGFPHLQEGRGIQVCIQCGFYIITVQIIFCKIFNLYFQIQNVDSGTETPRKWGRIYDWVTLPLFAKCLKSWREEEKWQKQFWGEKKEKKKMKFKMRSYSAIFSVGGGVAATAVVLLVIVIQVGGGIESCSAA